jgi:hypothetical protein
MRRFFFNLLLVWLLGQAGWAWAGPGQAQPDQKLTAAQAEIVKSGFYLISLHNFNFREKEYTARFWLWMFYKDPQLDFANTLDIPNAKEFDKQSVLLDSLVDEHGQKLYWLQMKIRAVMKQSWRVRDYPFDAQTLYIRLENSKFDNTFLKFVADRESYGQIYDRRETIDGWEVVSCTDTVVANPYDTNFGDPEIRKKGWRSSNYSQLLLTIKLRRAAWSLFLKIFIGMYVAVAIAMVSFFLHPRLVEPRFALPVGALFATVGNKYVIDSLLPETTEFTLVDMLHTASFVFIFGVLAVSAWSLYRYGHAATADRHRLRRQDFYAGLTLISLYLLFNLGMVAGAVLTV